MIKIEDKNSIKIYRSINKDKMKTSMKLFFVTLLLSLIMLIVFKYFIFLVLTCGSIVLLLIAFKLYIQKDEEKLVFSLSKQNFIIYKKNNEYYKLKDIISFMSFNDNANKVCLNYYDEMKNKKSKIFRVYGCQNTEFVNLANTYLKENINHTDIKEKEIEVENKKIELINNTDQITNEIVNNNNSLNFILIGKSKMFYLNGTSYILKNLYTDLIFLNEKNEILELPVKFVSIDWNELLINGIYEISYNKTKDRFFVNRISNEEEQKTNLINDIENNLVYSSKYIFDKQKILNEVKLYNKIMNATKITGLLLISLLLIICLARIIIVNINKTAVESINIIFSCTVVLGFIIPIIVYFLFIILSISKFKKDNLMH